MSQWSTAIVLGLGASGEAAARLLLDHGVAVTVIDRAAGPDVQRRAAALEEAKASVIVGSEELPAAGFDVAVASPGVPLDSAWVKQLTARKVPVIAELELAWSRCRTPIIAVTGSNGKSTMVKFCSDALLRAGKLALPAGNYGIPLSQVVRENAPLDWIVCEVSSFQLEVVSTFAPAVRVVMNIDPNHLDRHGTMESYVGAKCRLFERMGIGDTAVVSSDCAGLVEARIPAAGRQGRWLKFGVGEGDDCRYEDGAVVLQSGDETLSVDFSGTMFDNDILGRTAAAAVGVLTACGVDVGTIEEAAQSFVPLPHRMTNVATINGVRFIDDSKGTTLASMVAALSMAHGPVRLIAGGLLKESDLAAPKKPLTQKAAKVYLIGAAAETMENAWSDAVPCVRCGTLEGAVSAAWADSREGDVVLLSPGCASFDQFSGYAERGNRFAEIVRSLEGRRT